MWPFVGLSASGSTAGLLHQWGPQLGKGSHLYACGKSQGDISASSSILTGIVVPEISNLDLLRHNVEAVRRQARQLVLGKLHRALVVELWNFQTRLDGRSVDHRPFEGDIVPQQRQATSEADQPVQELRPIRCTLDIGRRQMMDSNVVGVEDLEPARRADRISMHRGHFASDHFRHTDLADARPLGVRRLKVEDYEVV